MTWLRNFDTASPEEIATLPRAVRKLIVADRKERVTAALQRFAAKGRRAAR